MTVLVVNISIQEKGGLVFLGKKVTKEFTTDYNLDFIIKKIEDKIKEAL
jgi:hypothetical protein